MTENTGQTPSTEEIDDLLEQAGMSVAESDFDTALPLLKKAKQYGDESQQEMAGAYLQMIEEMFPSDAQAEETAFADDTIAEEFTETTDQSLFEQEAVAETIVEDTADQSLFEQEIVDETTEDAAEELILEQEAAEEAIEEAAEEPILEQEAAEETIEEAAEEPILEQEEAEETAIEEPVAEQAVEEIIEAIAEEPEPMVAETSIKPPAYQAETSDQEAYREHDIALQQASTMIEAGEREIAEDLLNSVLESTDQRQRQQAQTLLAQINPEQQPPVKEEPVEEPQAAQTEKQPAPMSAEDMAEMELALSQSELLVSDGENDLARALLEMVLADGNDLHRKLARQLMDQVEQAEAMAEIQAQTPSPTKADDTLVEEKPKAPVQKTDTIIKPKRPVEPPPQQKTPPPSTEPNRQHGVDLLDPVTALSGGISLSADDQATVMPLQASALQGAEYRQGFRIGGIGLMIRYIDGSSLADLPDFYSMPNAPEWFCGVANLHGSIIPGFDLKNLFGLAEQEANSPMFLVLGHDKDRTGIVVDALPQRLSWTAEQESDVNTAPDFLRPYVKQACIIADELWYDLDSSALCQALEKML